MDALGHETRRLFQFLRRRWLPQPDLDAGFLKSLDGFSDIQQQLCSDRRLGHLSAQMYPDLQRHVRKGKPESSGNGVPRKRGEDKLSIEELHLILQIIQTMEIAWMNARMEDFDAHPLNRGWVAVFHRWAMMPAFRRAWPVLRADFSRLFIEYLESRFSMRVSYSHLEPLPAIMEDGDRKRVRQILVDEFRAEWPEIDSAFLKSGDSLAWYIFPRIPRFSGDGTDVWRLPEVPLGFVALLPPRSRAYAGKENEAFFSCDDKAPELRFWVRPQYRFLGVGRHLLNHFALRALQDQIPQKFSPKKKQPVREYAAWNSESNLVTRYFVRTGQEGGRNLRRRMQLGFLYEYSFCRQDDRPYDELASENMMRDEDGLPAEDSEYGIDRDRTVDSQESLVPSILATTWHRYFEASRAMSGSPGSFSRYVSQGDHS